MPAAKEDIILPEIDPQTPVPALSISDSPQRIIPTTPEREIDDPSAVGEEPAQDSSDVEIRAEGEKLEDQPMAEAGGARHRPRKTALDWAQQVGSREPSARRKQRTQAFRTVTEHQKVPVLSSIKAALEGPNSKEWKAALNSEMKSMRDNDVWELVPRPKNVNIVGSKWVLALKVNEKGEVERYKARLVAQGFTQRKEVDYSEVFASVIGKTTTRAMFHIAAHRNMEIDVVDVSTAFLNAELHEGVYMKQPPGFEDPEHPDWVCRLKKSLYGLKQAARCWFQELSKFLTSQGFEAHPLDPCLFT